MRVHLPDNEIIESTDIAQWPVEAQVVLFRTVDSGVATELRFEAELNGEERWVYIKTTQYKYLSFSSEELDLKDRLLRPATIEPVKQSDEV